MEGQHDRVSGAPWFDYLSGKSVIIGGAGGIGSFVSFLLSRISMEITIFDMDTFEIHNMSGQLVPLSGIGKKKVDVAAEIATAFSDHTNIIGMDTAFTTADYPSEIMISCFDNMKARKDMFTVWKEGLSEASEESKKEFIFIDGRLNAEQYQIYCVKGDSPEDIERYETEFLFSDEEADAGVCSFKQTTHCAAGIASHMVGYLTNFASNIVNNTSSFSVPFRMEYISTLNLMEEE